LSGYLLAGEERNIIQTTTHADNSDRLVYRSMQSHIRHLDGMSPEVDELAAEAIDDAGEHAPLLNSYSSESVDDESVSTIRPSRPRSP
jgi:hypothetical protein